MTAPDHAYGGSARPFSATTATSPVPATSGTSSARSMQAGTAVSGPRRVRLTVARIDPWSVMKLTFLLSVAVGIALVVMIGVLWTILDSMGVFSSVNGTIAEVLGGADGTTFNLMDYIGFTRVLSLATVIAVVDVFLLTALATLGAFIYNVCSSLVGGVHLTLTDD